MKRGLFSVSYAGYWGQDELDTVEFIRKAGDLGFDGVLLAAKRPHLSPLEAGPQMFSRVAKALEQTGVELIGLAAYTDFLLPAPGEIPVVEMQELYVDACVRVCAELGGSLVRVFTGYDRGGESRGSQEATVLGALRRCAERAGSRGVRLSLQNHHDLAVDTREFEQLLDTIGSPYVVAGYDAWSPHLRGEDLYVGARSMALRTGMTICADYRTYPRYRYQPELVNYLRLEPDVVKAVEMGTGEVDYDAFFGGLRDGGFDGWVVYEMCSPVVGGGAMENLDRYGRAFLAWCDRQL